MLLSASSDLTKFRPSVLIFCSGIIITAMKTKDVNMNFQECWCQKNHDELQRKSKLYKPLGTCTGRLPHGWHHLNRLPHIPSLTAPLPYRAGKNNVVKLLDDKVFTLFSCTLLSPPVDISSKISGRWSIRASSTF